MSEPLLEIDGVSRVFDLGRSGVRGPRRHLHALDRVSLRVHRGETLGLVGESGCGKSTLARIIAQLDRPTDGTLRFDGQDMAQLDRRALHAARQRFQLVFQDPQASLNPRMTARQIIAEPLLNYRRGGDIDAQVTTLAELIGLSAHHLGRFPHELSGGQCQRVGIARAIALEPELIVADEPVSALDVSIQAQILNLILRLQDRMGLTLVLVSHDLSVVAHVADTVAVMYLGRIVEYGPVDAVFDRAAHPYTQTLLRAVPEPTPRGRDAARPPVGELPSPIDPPSGCHFRTRCPFVRPLCAQQVPALQIVQGEHRAACHFSDEIAQAAIEADAEGPAHG
ncbi:ABC transporter ATP-binding protein [Roseicitreum antarcticum]|uniref:Peptide/nickel transport system ATP-binding protein n=1 Tax=Roseicitreum antarcticum TaxID=564137 RepID=A0A1H3ASX1_9RHOB|nr:oligopeptide/dipeptide ABC transporter ATP-binding protein [Roseicitreum antarcticum]SDX32776.1 peptide/nickel transport system ATP-binding protein [Roseicitreum antarcticum]